MSEERKTMVVRSSKHSPRDGGGCGCNKPKPCPQPCPKPCPGPCDHPKPCCPSPKPPKPTPTPTPICDGSGSELVGEGLAAIQTAISTLFAPSDLATELVTGFLYSGFGLLVELSIQQTLDAANTVADIVAAAKLSQNKTLARFVTSFASNVVTLTVAVVTVVLDALGGSPIKNPDLYAEALAAAKDFALRVLDAVYRAHPVRSCPTSLRQLKDVLDAGILLLMLANFFAFLIGIFVDILIKILTKRKRLGPGDATAAIDTRFTTYVSKVFATKDPIPTSFPDMPTFFAGLKDIVFGEFDVLSAGKRHRKSK
jgi:hypothetical protein